MKDEKQYSESFFKQAISAFRFFYGHILEHAGWKTLKFIKPQKERRLPDVLSREEVKLILSHVRVPRQKAFLFTLYSLGLRLSELFYRFGQAYLDRYGSQMSPSHGKTLHDIRQCRTSVMGGKRYDCPKCQAKQYAYHSCNNRHCPKCGGDKTEGWLKKQFDRLLPVPYFFATFTLPAPFREIFRSHQKICYALFFEASAQALKEVAANKRFVGGNIGFEGVLQTWTSELFYHPHLHYIIPGVALSKNHKNRIKIKNKKFLMHVNPPALRFKNLFRQALEKRHPELYLQVPENVWSRDVNWVVHCEAAGYGREVIQYLAPYIFRTAMTDQRNLTLHDDAT
jgi:hypothetical protein